MGGSVPLVVFKAIDAMARVPVPLRTVDARLSRTVRAPRRGA